MNTSKPSEISLYDHVFFKCCATWDNCRCSDKLTDYDKRYRDINSTMVKIQLMYNKHQDYQEFKKICPGVSFGDFISGNILRNKT